MKKLYVVAISAFFLSCSLSKNAPIIDVAERAEQNELRVVENKIDSSLVEVNIAEKPVYLPAHNFMQDEELNGMEKAKVLDSVWVSMLYDIEVPPFLSLEESLAATNPDEVNQVSPEELKERLALLESQTPFHLEYNAVLEQYINSYLKKRRKYYPALMARAAYYFPMFEKELDNYNIPLELKYLAIVESALKPRARSYVGATGLWQFMYATGRQYGLKTSSYVDEREDPVKATRAACRYLSNLYDMFGDWDLALAAYNSGPGNVSKAIKRSGGYTNYWNIRPYLPRETAGYVPAFYANMYLFEFAEEHGLGPDNSPEVPFFATENLEIEASVSFEQLSRILDISIPTLEFLNPQYRLDIVPYVKDKNYTVRVPLASANKFYSMEQEVYALFTKEASQREKPLPKYYELNQRIRYRVRTGDYLGLIAKRYGVSVGQIKKWNNLRTDRLKVGQRLTIYPKRLNRSV
jgi:membrane-bound lytic murein transglycosylase D